MTVHQFPVGRSDERGWPVFDMPRPDTGYDGVGQRHVQAATEITMKVDATDEFVRVPVRAVFVDDGLTGWALEIGPYSIACSDACDLANALRGYGQLSGDFGEQIIPADEPSCEDVDNSGPGV